MKNNHSNNKYQVCPMRLWWLVIIMDREKDNNIRKRKIWIVVVREEVIEGHENIKNVWI